MKKLSLIALMAFLAVTIAAFYGCQSASKGKATEGVSQKSGSSGIANPASVNCKNKGGELKIKKGPGGEYGVCVFEDNYQCEEWALFRGECPVGGLRITGYNGNEAEIFCTITGGTCIAGGDTCEKGGKKCPINEYYEGKCRP